jgi:hypothetical protein
VGDFNNEHLVKPLEYAAEVAASKCVEYEKALEVVGPRTQDPRLVDRLIKDIVEVGSIAARWTLTASPKACPSMDHHLACMFRIH